MLEATTKLSDELIDQINEALKSFHPETAILLGSYVWGQPMEDGDIALYVVTKGDFVPSTNELWQAAV